MKPGYKTSEFYLSLAAMLLGALVASGLFDPAICTSPACLITSKIVGGLLTILGALGYGKNRSDVKAAASLASAAASVNPPKPPQS